MTDKDIATPEPRWVGDAAPVEPYAVTERVINILWNELGIQYEATVSDAGVTFAPKAQ